MKFPSVIHLFLIYSIFLFSTPTAFAQSKPTETRLVYTLKNRDALLKDREIALKQLAQEPNEVFRKTLFKLLENPHESKRFQAQITETMADMDDPELTHLLRNQLKNSQATAGLRKQALYILWKRDIKTAVPLVHSMAENKYEQENFRLTAISYLAHLPEEQKNIDLALKIIKDPEESDRLKKAAMGILKAGNRMGLLYDLYRDTVTDTKASIPSRKAAILKSQSLLSLQVEEDLLSILKNPREKMELRKTALAALRTQKNRLDKLLPEFEALLETVSNWELRNQLKKAINEIQTPEKS